MLDIIELVRALSRAKVDRGIVPIVVMAEIIVVLAIVL